MVFGLGRLGLFSFEGVIISIVGTFIAFPCLNFGEYIRQQLSADTFRLALLSMLTVMGVGLVYRAF